MSSKETTPVKEETRDTMELLDGTVLKCYRKDEIQNTVLDHDNQLDYSGVYLRLKRKSSQKTSQKHAQMANEENENLKFFLDHAFLFLRNAEVILNDSRMFLAPVPVHSGLAYSGSSGFASPTLGVYVEWWIRNTELVDRDLMGKEALTYQILGSPLSGSNRCKCVYPDGTIETIVHRVFLKVWTSFVSINSRYRQAMQMYHAYSLQEVVEAIESSHLPETDHLQREIRWHERRCHTTQHLLEQQKAKTIQLDDNLRQVSHRLCELLLAPLVNEYHVRQQTYLESEAQFQRDKCSCKYRFKSGQISSDEYQRLMKPFNKRRKAGRVEFVDYIHNQVARFSTQEHIPVSIIWDYLESQACPRV